ncbi:MAG: ABC transporter permease [Legionella sp.]
MMIKQQFISVYTLIRREFRRMFRIFSQVFLPPVITTLLYFLIFGSVVGQRVGAIQGIEYSLFIAPGLIMMAVITNAYANVSGSLFGIRFQNNIEEMLVSPMHYSLMLLGFTLGGVLRGIIVATLVFLVSAFFVDINMQHLPLSLLIVVMIATLFSLAGFANGLLARNFDDIAIVPTFILGPLTYLGGVFYSPNMLSGVWQKLLYLNPIFHMISSFRQTLIGQQNQDIDMIFSISIIASLLLILIIVNLVMLKKGVGIRQ